MSVETIGVDADDVIAAHAAAFARFSNENYGTNITADEYDDDWFRFWGDISMEEVERRATEFHTPEITLEYAKIEEAVPVLEELHDDYRLALITARPQQIVAVTHDWLDIHYNGVFDEVHFVPIWEPTNTITKADICRSIGADYLLDDAVRHCNPAVRMGITALLFGKNLYPTEEVDPRVIQVEDWDMVRNYFQGIRGT
jgi:uncharacterized HAD superfamily protein